eukprot:m.373678 g.373678  ORF g.373678 m.373678 type:complete len:342 (-) comp19999_c0_seq8:841-1866(-)
MRLPKLCNHGVELTAVLGKAARAANEVGFGTLYPREEPVVVLAALALGHALEIFIGNVHVFAGVQDIPALRLDLQPHGSVGNVIHKVLVPAKACIIQPHQVPSPVGKALEGGHVFGPLGVWSKLGFPERKQMWKRAREKPKPPLALRPGGHVSIHTKHRPAGVRISQGLLEFCDRGIIFWLWHSEHAPNVCRHPAVDVVVDHATRGGAALLLLSFTLGTVVARVALTPLTPLALVTRQEDSGQVVNVVGIFQSRAVLPDLNVCVKRVVFLQPAEAIKQERQAHAEVARAVSASLLADDNDVQLMRQPRQDPRHLVQLGTRARKRDGITAKRSLPTTFQRKH